MSELFPISEPEKIDVPNVGFSKVEIDIMHTMMNYENNDYSTVDEVARVEYLSKYSYELIRHGIFNLKRRGFLLEVKKPYGYVYAVNKKRIPNMMFKY